MRPVFKNLAILLVGLTVSYRLSAGEPGGNLDDQLLQDLKESDSSAAPLPQRADADKEVDRELMQDLNDGEDLGEKPEDAFQQLAQQMKQSQQRIGTRDTSAETQEIQRDISHRLAQLIEQAQKQARSGEGQSKSGAGKPGNQGNADGAGPKPGAAAESTKRVDQAVPIEQNSADVHETIRRVWGHLPEKMREQMLNSLDDQFLPKYESLIERYYQRLAEQPGQRP